MSPRFLSRKFLQSSTASIIGWPLLLAYRPGMNVTRRRWIFAAGFLMWRQAAGAELSSPACKQFDHSGDDFADLDGTKEDFRGGAERHSCSSRGNDNGWDTAGKRLNGGFGRSLRVDVKDDRRRALTRSDGPGCVRRGLDSKRVNAAFAQLGANSGAELPVFADHEYNWHPRSGV